MGNSKVWILITGIVVMLSGFLLFSTLKSKEAERSSFMTKMQGLQTKIAELSKLQTDLDEMKAQKAELEAKLQADLSAMETQLADSKKNEASLRIKLDTLTKEKDSLNKYMENNNTIIAKLQKKIEGLERDKKQLQEEIKSVSESTFAPVAHFTDPMSQPSEETASYDKAESPVAKLVDNEGGSKLTVDDTVDLGRIILRKSTSQPAAVEYVNTLYGFVVLSAGTNDGLKKDAVVLISRNNRLIAKAVVKKVRQETASAVTMPEWTREEIRVGDLVSVSGIIP